MNKEKTNKVDRKKNKVGRFSPFSKEWDVFLSNISINQEIAKCWLYRSDLLPFSRLNLKTEIVKFNKHISIINKSRIALTRSLFALYTESFIICICNALIIYVPFKISNFLFYLFFRPEIVQTALLVHWPSNTRYSQPFITMTIDKQIFKSNS